MLINTNQAVMAKYHYDPFGNTLSMSGLLAEANTYRFSSKEFHANSGLYYYGYRFYDPNLQRWPNRDPLGEVGFQELLGATEATQYGVLIGEGSNLYVYVHNNPVSNTDVHGLWSRSSCPTPCSDPTKPGLPDLDAETEKVVKKLKSKVKDLLLDALGKRTFKDAIQACNDLDGCLKGEEGSGLWDLSCILCSVWKCAKSLPASPIAARNCLNTKAVGCAFGIKP